MSISIQYGILQQITLHAIERGIHSLHMSSQITTDHTIHISIHIKKLFTIVAMENAKP